MNREETLAVARRECERRCLDARRIVAVTVGAGWMIVYHAHGEILVQL